MEPLVGNTDGQRPDPHRPPTVLHQQTSPVHSAAQTSPTAVDEVDAVVGDVETDEVTAEDALEDDVMPREYLDHVPGREGDVKEEADLAGNVLLLRDGPDGGGGQHEVVVVDPDDGNVVRILDRSTRHLTTRIYIIYLLHSCDCIDSFESELDVDVPVGDPVGLVEDRPVRHGVEEGPEGGVAAAVVVELVILSREEVRWLDLPSTDLVCQMDRNHLTAQQTRGGRVVTRLRLREVTILRQSGTRPSHPHSLALDHHRSHGCDQTSGSGLAPEGPVSTSGDSEGETVGDHEEA